MTPGLCIGFGIDFRASPCCFQHCTKMKIVKNARTVVQKSTLRSACLMTKYHLRLVRNSYQNLFKFRWILLLNSYLLRVSSYNAFLASNVLQNEVRKDPKSYGSNWGSRPGDHLAHLKGGSWAHNPLPGSSRTSFWPLRLTIFSLCKLFRPRCGANFGWQSMIFISYNEDAQFTLFPSSFS